METKDLYNLLDESRRWNTTHGITGMMLYIKGDFLAANQGRFIQVIEGSQDIVQSIFEKIKSDPRHHQIVVLNESTTNTRNFGDWSMGFKSVSSKEYRHTPGYFELNDKILKTRLNMRFNAPLTMLQSFYMMHANSIRS